MSNIQTRGLLTLAFITGYIEEHGYSPTYQEIADELRTSKSVVSKDLDRLESKGYLTTSNGGEWRTRSRTIVLSGRDVHFSPEEYQLLITAWGDDIKAEILEAAAQTRFVITA